MSRCLVRLQPVAERQAPNGTECSWTSALAVPLRNDRRLGRVKQPELHHGLRPVGCRVPKRYTGLSSRTCHIIFLWLGSCRDTWTRVRFFQR